MGKFELNRGAMLSTKEELEAILRTLDVWVIVFGVFVAIGVAGESIVGFVHFRKSSQLHRLQTTENLAQQAEIERLKSEAASIHSDTAKALERAAHAEEQAAELNKQAEAERLARVQLQTAIEPRRLSAEEQKEITEACRPFARPDVKIIVKSTNGDEAGLAIQIADALRKAGFNVDREINSGVFYELAFGSPLDHLDIAQELIGIVAKKTRMPIVAFPQILPPGSPITILIGQKHQGQLPKITPTP